MTTDTMGGIKNELDGQNSKMCVDGQLQRHSKSLKAVALTRGIER